MQIHKPISSLLVSLLMSLTPAHAEADAKTPEETLESFLQSRSGQSPLRGASCSADEGSILGAEPNPCDDFFGSICSSRSKIQLNKKEAILNQVTDKIIVEAKDLGAKAAGFESFAAMVRDRFQRQGFGVLQNVSPATFSNAVEAISQLNSGSPGHQHALASQAVTLLFTPFQECKSFLEKQGSTGNELEVIQKSKSTLIQIYSRNYPAFVTKVIEGCRAKQSAEIKKNSPNLTAQEVAVSAELACSATMNDAIQADRKGENRAGFIEKHFADATEAEFTPWGPNPFAVLPNNDKATAAYQCQTLIKEGYFFAYRIIQDTQREALSTPAAVNYVVKKHQVPDAVRQMDTDLKIAKESIQKMISPLVQDPNKKKLIEQKLAAIQIKRLSIPEKSAYVPNEFGTLTLKRSSSALYTGTGVPPASMVFQDPQLNYFRVVNAQFFPRTQIGAIAETQHISLRPHMELLAAVEPEMGFATIAHEVGHLLGPELSAISGISTKKLFGPLLSCLQSPNSVNVLPEQLDEAVADVMAAEVLADKVATFSKKEERVSYLKKSMLLLCGIDNPFGGYDRDSHPTPYQRIVGIYGANPTLRKMLDCPEGSSPYKECGVRK